MSFQLLGNGREERGRKQERLGREGEERNRKKEGGRKRKRNNGGREKARVRQSSRDWILSHYYVTFLTKISLKEVYVWVHSLRGFSLSWHPGGKAWLQGQLAAGRIASVVRKQ